MLSTAVTSQPAPVAAPPPVFRSAHIDPLAAVAVALAAVGNPSGCAHVGDGERVLPLIGVPRSQLDELSTALAKDGAVDEALLRDLLEGRFHATPLAPGLAEDLVDRGLPALLPGADDAVVGVWRDVLVHALRLPPREWEVACLSLRPLLWEPSVVSPLLQALRDALYRPFDMSREAWPAQLTAVRAQRPEASARDLALDMQRARMPGWDNAQRWAQVKSELVGLAHDAAPEAIDRGMAAIRRLEQRDRGLVDPRWGLGAVFEHVRGRSPDAPDRPRELVAIFEALAGREASSVDSPASPPTQAQPRDETSGSQLSALLLDVASNAEPDRETGSVPIGRYDTWRNALASLLSIPGGLEGMRTTVSDAAFAIENVTRGRGAASRVADATRGFVSQEGWMQRQLFPVDSVNDADMDVRHALEGRGAVGTALVAIDQCRSEWRAVPGLTIARRQATNRFLGTQGWLGGGVTDPAMAYVRKPPASTHDDMAEGRGASKPRTTILSPDVPLSHATGAHFQGVESDRQIGAGGTDATRHGLGGRYTDDRAADSTWDAMRRLASAIDRRINLFDQASGSALHAGRSPHDNIAVLRTELSRIIHLDDIPSAVLHSALIPDPASPLGEDIRAFMATIQTEAFEPVLASLEEGGFIAGIGRDGASGACMIGVLSEASSTWTTLAMPPSLVPDCEQAMSMALVVDPSGAPVRVDGKVSLRFMLDVVGLALLPVETKADLEDAIARLPDFYSLQASGKSPANDPDVPVVAMETPRLSLPVIVPLDSDKASAALEQPPAGAIDALGICNGLSAGQISRALAGANSDRTIATPNDLFNFLGVSAVSYRGPGYPDRLRLLPAELTVTPAEAWERLLKGNAFHVFAHSLAQELAWVNPASPRMIEQLGRAAISRFLVSPEERKPGYILDINLWGATELDLSYPELYSRGRDAIARKYPGSTPAAIDLMAELIFSEVAPELLVPGTPLHITGRSLQGVAFLQGMALLDGAEPSASKGKSFSTLATLPAQIASTNGSDLHDAWSQALATPALRYAKAHQMIDFVNLEDVTSDQLKKAIELVQHDQKSSAEDMQRLLTQMPDRRSIARDVLRKAAVPESYWDKLPIGRAVHEELEGYGLTVADGYAWDRMTANIGISISDIGSPQEKPVEVTLLERVMMGEINAEQSVPDMYDTAFRRFREATNLGMSNIVNRLLHELPAPTRTRLSTSTCEVSRVSLDGKGDTYQGIFVRCQPGNHLDDFNEHRDLGEFRIEIFPMAGVVRPSSRPFNYHRRNERQDTFNDAYAGALEERKREDRLRPLEPLDSDAYLTGTVSFNERAPAHPIRGVLVPAGSLVYDRAAQGEGMALAALSTAVAEHMLTSFLDDAKKKNAHGTSWERIWEGEREVVDGFARMIVPFYSCAKDLSLGKHSEGVIVGCEADAAFALIPMGEFIGTTARVVTREGKLVVSAVCEELVEPLGNLVASLARQSPVGGAMDLARGVGRFAVASWEKLKTDLGMRGMLSGGKVGVGESVVTFDRLHHVAAQDFAGGWEAAHPGQSLKHVDGVPNVIVGKDAAGKLYSLDPANGLLYGSPLMKVSDEGRLASHLSKDVPFAKVDGGYLMLDETPDLSKQWVQQGDDIALSAGGVNYKKVDLDDGGTVLRRTDESADASSGLVGLPCRRAKSPVVPACPVGVYTNEGYTGMVPGSTTGEGPVAWFNDRRITVDAKSRVLIDDNRRWVEANGEFVPDGVVLKHTDYKQRVVAEMTAGDDFSKQITMAGIVDGVEDSRKISAIVVVHEASGETYLATRADRGIFYKGKVMPGTTAVTMEKMTIDPSVVGGASARVPGRLDPHFEDNYLAVTYAGTADANKRINELGWGQVEGDLRRIEAEIVGGHVHDSSMLGLGADAPYRLKTTPAQAILFSNYAKRARLLEIRGTNWKPISANTPEIARDMIAFQLNRIGMKTLDRNSVILSESIERFVEGLAKEANKSKNFAFVRIRYKDAAKADDVVYSLSGYQDPTRPLAIANPAKNRIYLGKNWTKNGEGDWLSPRAENVDPRGTRYVNAQPKKPAGGVRDGDPRDPHDGGILFIPDHSRGVGPDGAGMNFRFSDSERNIASWFRRQGTPGDQIESIDLFTTQPACHSCTYLWGGIRAEMPEVRFNVYEGPKP